MGKKHWFEQNGMKKGSWSQEEDDKLRAYIQRYGHWNWRQLPRFAGLSRCGKSCRLRWMNYLRPHVKRGNYSKEEEDLILKLRDELGNKWSVIASKLSGRTDNEVKNYWHTHLKKRVKQNSEKAQVMGQSGDTSPFEGVQKEQPVEVSQSEDNYMFSQPSSSGHSSSNSDYALSSGTGCVVEDCITSVESYVEPLGNFWTEPFLPDTTYNQSDFSSFLVEGGFMSPNVSYYYHDIELFDYLMQELPEN